MQIVSPADVDLSRRGSRIVMLLAFASSVLCAVGGFAASLFVPGAPAPSPGLRLSRNPVAANSPLVVVCAQMPSP